MLKKFERPSFRNRGKEIKKGDGQKELPSREHREEKSLAGASSFQLSEELDKKIEEIEKRKRENESRRTSGAINLSEERARIARQDAEKSGKKNFEDYYGDEKTG